jgi:hypothetical protein
MDEKRLFQKAVRSNIPLKIAIIGPSGSGKTFSALRLASGIGGTIALLDTENKRALHYADLFDFLHLPFSAPYSPERFVSAITAAEAEGVKTLIIDSASHEWIGPGGCLEIHAAIPGNSYVAWAKVTPRHAAFLQKIVDSPINIITCMRGKDEYILDDNVKGKKEPRKIGVGAVQRDGIEYEHTCSFLLDIQHTATVQKDTTGVFPGTGVQVLAEDHGKKLAAWAAGKTEPKTKGG